MDNEYEMWNYKDAHTEVCHRLKEGFVMLDTQVQDVKEYVGERIKDVIGCLRTCTNPKKISVLESAKEFYENAFRQLSTIQQLFQEHKISNEINSAIECELRTKPPFHISQSKLKKAFTYCKNHLEKSNDVQPRIDLCNCFWANIPEYNLEYTQDIIDRPKCPPSSEFDESDLKFKQDMVKLRTKLFSMSRNFKRFRLQDGFIRASIVDRQKTGYRSGTRKNFDEIVTLTDSFAPPVLETELKRVGILKFVDGEFKTCEVWLKLLDSRGQQLRSRWQFVMQPQIESITRKRLIPVLHLVPVTTYEFLSMIKENGINFTLHEDDLVSLLDNQTEEAAWLTTWKPQFATIHGKNIAAGIIQKYWRGHKLRKQIFESDCKYIAASVLWACWIVVKKKRQMHINYLQSTLKYANVTKDLVETFSRDYNSLIQQPHFVIHLPSMGLPQDLRKLMPSAEFSVYQNVMALKISFLRNPSCQVLYVLPVSPNEDLLTMYHDLIESVYPEKNFQKRVTYIELSEAKTFKSCSFNVSRNLYCSVDTMDAITKKIDNMPAYFLPWVLDECEIRLAGLMNIPLLAPEMELQNKLLNKSYMASLITELELEQPVYATNIRDYGTLCTKMAELICLHTEVCLWLIKINLGDAGRQTGVFLINHISIPFMPILRKERDSFGNEWKNNPELRTDFLNSMMHHLPQVVSVVTRLSSVYKSWRQFCGHINKYGCLLQAVPNEKMARSVTVMFFVPAHNTGQPPEIIGTADRLYLDPTASTIFGYMIPQTSVDTRYLQPTVNRLAAALQSQGYFGHLSIDLFCYPHIKEDRTVVLVVDVDPFYGPAQHYIDWMLFTINGTYIPSTNTLDGDVDILPEARKRKASMIPSTTRIFNWNETTERYGIAISHLYHNRFPRYSWNQLRDITENCGIQYNAYTKEGSHFILHDGEQKNDAMVVVIGSSMHTILSATGTNLKKLAKFLGRKPREGKPDTNIMEAAKFFQKLSLEYRSVTMDRCSAFRNVK